jgi:uncharacterized protein YdhG (YjbR/CyaY superfamily)
VARPIKTIDAYIGTFPDEVQVVLQQVRQTIRMAAPGALEAISYGMPTFKLNGRNLVLRGLGTPCRILPDPVGHCFV